MEKDNVRYEPYYGYMKGSLWTMWEGAGNDFDQAALLSDLLRAAGYETRFVIGTIEVEPAYMRQVLGVNTTEEALQLLWENYVPAEIENRKILVEHTWVEAYIPYHDYRGYVMDTESRSGWRWVPMDAAFVPYVAEEAYPVPDIDYDITSVFEQTLQNGTYGEDYFTGLNFSGLDFATEEMMNLTDEWYAENVGSVLENMTEEEVEALYADKPPEVEATIIPGTTPYAPLVFETYSEIPDEFLHIINIRVVEGATKILSFNIPSVETVGRQLTLDYVPANEDVAELVNAQALLTDLPAYLLDFRPILMLDSIIIAVGNASTFGTKQELQVTIKTPNQKDIVTSPLQVGNYYAVAFDLGDMPADNVERVLNNTLEGLAEDNIMVLDHSIGGYMSLSLLNYFAMVDMQSQMFAESMGLRWWRNSPAVAVFGTTFETEYTGSVPSSITTGPSHIDVVRNVLSIQADKSEKTFFTLMSGAISSSWESIMFDLFYNAPGTSTVDVMRLAMEQGVPVYHITMSNIDKVEQLSIPSPSKQAIRDSVNQGLEAYVPGTALTHANWTGIAWLVIDPSTGANAWMIGDDLGNVIHGGSSIHVSFASESHEFSTVGGYSMRTTEFVTTPESRVLKNQYLTEREKASEYLRKANWYGNTDTGNYYLNKYYESNALACSAYDAAKSLESTSNKSGNVGNSLTDLSNGMAEEEGSTTPSLLVGSLPMVVLVSGYSYEGSPHRVPMTLMTVGAVIVVALMISATNPNRIIDSYINPLGEEIPLREGRWKHIKEEHSSQYPFNQMNDNQIRNEIKRTIRSPAEIWYDDNGDAPSARTYFYFKEFEPGLYLIVVVGNVGIITSYPAGVDEIIRKCGVTRPYEVNIYPGGKLFPL